MTDFETKDSGVRAEYASGMVRDSEAGKARFDLLFPLNVPYEEQMMTRFANLMARGAEKYDPRNWEKARGEEELERYRSSAIRHLAQWIGGQTDEDHAAAVMFNLLAGETVAYRLRQPVFEGFTAEELIDFIDERPMGTVDGDDDDYSPRLAATLAAPSVIPPSSKAVLDSASDEPLAVHESGEWSRPCGVFNPIYKTNCLLNKGHSGWHRGPSVERAGYPITGDMDINWPGPDKDPC